MSTSRSRLTRSIQEIAKRDPDLRRAIEATKPRGDQPSAAGVGTSDAGRDRICCDGSVSNDANPGTEERDTGEGGQDANDGLSPDDTADISDMGPGSLTGLHDCATGEPVCFDGADWVPPDGWDSPTDGPYVYGYMEGLYFSFTDAPGNTYRAASVQGVLDIICSSPPCCAQKVNDYRYGELYASKSGQICNRFIGGYIEGHDCNGSSASYCNPTEDQIREDSWPSDSCVNLAIKSGSIVGSKYDPENDGSYSKPMSEIELCDDFGNSFYLSPSAGGGWKTINATKDAGYLWGSNGQKIAHINGNEYSDPSM